MIMHYNSGVGEKVSNGKEDELERAVVVKTAAIAAVVLWVAAVAVWKNSSLQLEKYLARELVLARHCTQESSSNSQRPS
eukprot:4990-Heterococcus_DN1.PRE.2